MTNPASISIVIRTFNSAKTLDQVLSKLILNQHDEIIIVDSGSTDNTMSIAKKWKCILHQTSPPFNYSRSLNEGFRLAQNPWILSLSSHCIPNHPSFLEDIRQALDIQKKIIAVYYGISSMVVTNKTDTEVTLGNLDDWNQGRFNPGGNVVALYRQDLWKIHPFDEKIVTAEDIEWLQWALQSGYYAAVIPNASVLYRNHGSLLHMFRKGWHETRISFVMLDRPIPKTTLLVKIKAFAIHVGFLSKRAIQRQITPGIFVRLLAHLAGSFLSSLARHFNYHHE